MRFAEEQKRIPCVLMRGGTSRALFVMRNDLPADPALRDRVILRMFGSPDVRQIDGIGGADPLTSKLAIIGPPTRPDADVDCTFAQVSIDRPFVDYAGEGLVDAVEPTTRVRIHQTNTRCILVAEVPVVNGKAAVEGDCHIDGVPGTGACIRLDFSRTAGAVTGRLLPTGSPRDMLLLPDGTSIEASVVDAGTPTVFVRARDLGLTGMEMPAEIDADPALRARIEQIRGTAAANLGIVDVWHEAAERSPYLPFFALIGEVESGPARTTDRAEYAADVDFTARVLFMLRTHKAYPVTGAVATGAAARIPGTVVYELARPESRERSSVRIGHPAGVLEIAVHPAGQSFHLERATIVRTARRILEGYILVPWSTWGGKAVDRRQG
ncbi:MAG: 2-methylaconitate cis-trans isomerase PrpF family protein [Chloroflexia bacterium]